VLISAAIKRLNGLFGICSGFHFQKGITFAFARFFVAHYFYGFYIAM
jgi:hypothetical protein